MGLTATRTTSQSPLGVARVRDHLRGSELPDSELISKVWAAVEEAESLTHRTLLSSTLVLTLDRFPLEIRLPGGPVSVVSSVQYVAATSGTVTTMDDADWTATTASEPTRITRAYGVSWPTPRNVLEAVRVTYTAGYGDTLEDAPRAIQEAVLLLVAEMHDGEKDSRITAERLLSRYTLGPQAAFAGLDNPCAIGTYDSGW